MALEAGLTKVDLKPPKRERLQSKLLAKCIVSTTLGMRGNHKPTSNWEQARHAYFGVIDAVMGEMTARFGQDNMALFLSVAALNPSTAQFLQPVALQQLRLLLAVDETTLAAELLVGRPFFAKKFTADCSLEKCTHLVAEFKEAFPNIYSLYAGACTIGMSTATCENSFSALTRILNPRRRSMTHQRKSELVLLAFEKKLTCSLDLDKFLAKFKLSNLSRRRIPL